MGIREKKGGKYGRHYLQKKGSAKNWGRIESTKPEKQILGPSRVRIEEDDGGGGERGGGA